MVRSFVLWLEAMYDQLADSIGMEWCSHCIAKGDPPRVGRRQVSGV